MNSFFGVNVVPPIVIESLPEGDDYQEHHLPDEFEFSAEEPVGAHTNTPESFSETGSGFDTSDLNGAATLSGDKERPGWLRRNRFKLAMAAAGVSLAASLIADPVEKELKPVAYAGAGMVGSDIVWTASAGVAYRAAFGKWKGLVHVSEDKLAARDHDSKTSKVARAIDNVAAMAFITKDDLAEAAERAHDSKTFKVAYAINTAAATAFFAIPTAIVTTKLPPESWGILTPSALEFSTTVAARLAINAKLKEHEQK